MSYHFKSFRKKSTVNFCPETDTSTADKTAKSLLDFGAEASAISLAFYSENIFNESLRFNVEPKIYKKTSGYSEN